MSPDEPPPGRLRAPPHRLVASHGCPRRPEVYDRRPSACAPRLKRASVTFLTAVLRVRRRISGPSRSPPSRSSRHLRPPNLPVDERIGISLARTPCLARGRSLVWTRSAGEWIAPSIASRRLAGCTEAAREVAHGDAEDRPRVERAARGDHRRTAPQFSTPPPVLSGTARCLPVPCPTPRDVVRVMREVAVHSTITPHRLRAALRNPQIRRP